MSPHKQTTEPEEEVTVQPRPLSDEIARPTAHEPGLSVDPEDLGTHFLNQATEQGNFESEEGDADGRALIEGPPSDEPLSGPNFEPERDVWEQTVDLALQSGDVLDREDDSAVVLPPELATPARTSGARRTGMHPIVAALLAAAATLIAVRAARMLRQPR